MKNKEKERIFDNAGDITSIIVGLIIVIILLSQSWAISNNVSAIIMFRSILNHNSIYFLLLIYFIGIKTSFGKKYFNHLNLFLMLLYLISSISSFLTVIQAFSLNSLLAFLINIVIFIYLFHTMLRGTRVWKDYKLKNSPFNEITNEWYYDFLLIVPTILLIVNLMASTSLNGVVISLMDYFYVLLFARYIYLYREFLDMKSINSKNPGNFDDLKKTIGETTDDIKDKVVDTIDDVKDDISDTINDVKDRVDDFIEDNKVDEKVGAVKDKVVDTAKDVKDKVDDFVEENKIDEKLDKVKDKVVDTATDVKDKVTDLVDDKPKKKKKKKKKTDKKGSE